jgi:hypothetical protein
MDKFATEKFCEGLILRIRDYKEHALELRNWALDANSSDAREMYLKRADQQERLAAKAEGFLKNRLGAQRYI